jgi:hypothetical protein
MPDWVYELAEAVTVLMERVTLAEALFLIAASAMMLPFVVLIHEAGHALAAVVVRARVAELTVGDDAPVVTVHVGGSRFRLGATTGKGDAAGFVLYDHGTAAPRNVFVIALAGPLASLAGAIVTGVLAAWTWPHPGFSLCFASATLAGFVCCVENLRVSGTGPASWSDGVWVRGAWRAMQAPSAPDPAARWSDPNAATSIPPPGH